MSEATDKIIALNVRLKSSESSVNPRATSHTNVGLAQGIAHADFGFIEPALLAAIAKTAKDGQGRAEGTGRHARHPRGDGVDVLARLHQQIQQVLVGLTDAPQSKPNA
jgi:hypothetical protein